MFRRREHCGWKAHFTIKRWYPHVVVRSSTVHRLPPISSGHARSCKSGSASPASEELDELLEELDELLEEELLEEEVSFEISVGPSAPSPPLSMSSSSSSL